MASAATHEQQPQPLCFVAERRIPLKEPAAGACWTNDLVRQQAIDAGVATIDVSGRVTAFIKRPHFPPLPVRGPIGNVVVPPGACLQVLLEKIVTNKSATPGFNVQLEKKGPQPSEYNCPNGHTIMVGAYDSDWSCGWCGREFEPSTARYSCEECGIYMCTNCATNYASQW